MNASPFFRLALLFIWIGGLPLWVTASEDVIRLKSRTFVPEPGRASALSVAEDRYVLIQFEKGRMKSAVKDLKGRGVRILEWVPDRAVSAFVPKEVPLSHEGVRWVGRMGAEDKLSERLHEAEETDVHVLVDFFPGVEKRKALTLIRDSGGKNVPHPSLPGDTYLVSTRRDRLRHLAARDAVSYIMPASKVLIQGREVHFCAGAMTEYGPMGNYVTKGEGWDGAGTNAVSLRYHFHNGTPDVSGEHAEVERAMAEWSRVAQITWSESATSGNQRQFDIRWTFDGGDGPGGVLAWAYYPSPPNGEPIAGDMFFDEGENWRIGADIDLFTVALHELGHSLGLDHSSDPNAVMYPSYQGRVSGLASDDIAGIRRLYASTEGGGGGGSSGDSFEPNNSAGSATLISSGSNQSHSIDPVGDEDWLRFELSGSADVILETFGSSGDTRLWLYDSGLNQVAFNDDGGSGLFSRIDRLDVDGNALPQGTFYVKVDEYGSDGTIGSYNVSLDVKYVSLGDAYEPDNTTVTATRLSPGTPQVHSIVPATDVDYYVFSLTEESDVVIETNGPSGDTRMWLFGSSLSAIEYNDDGGSGLFSRIDRRAADGDALPAGTYYVSIDDYENDNEIPSYTMTLSINTRGGGGSDAYESNDTLATAWDPGFNWEGTWLSEMQGLAVQEGDDFYAIEVSPSGFERVQVDCRFTHAEGDIDIALYDDTGVLLAYSDSVTDNEFIDHVVPASGTYSIRVYYGDAGNIYDLWWDDLEPVSSSPELSYQSHTIDDDSIGESDGNGDGVVQAGETVEVVLKLQNTGAGTANGVSATISTSDTYITLVDVSESFPDIAGGDAEESVFDYDFEVSPNTPDGHIAVFTLAIESAEGTWTDSFSITIRNPDSLNTRRPPFNWPEVFWATWYQIWVNRNGETYHTQWVEGATSWTPSSDWPGGSYSWWVRGWDPLFGYRSWSSENTFNIPVKVPGRLTLLSPRGEQDGTSLMYRWEKDPAANWYRLWVGGERSGTWYDQWFNLTGDGEAAERPGTRMPKNAGPEPTGPTGTAGSLPVFEWSGGKHGWWMRGWSPDGYGPWSGPLDFTVPYPANTWVRVYLNRGDANVFDLWTTENSLTAPTTLQPGSYSWWMGVWEPTLRQTFWSGRMDFEVQ